MALIFPAATERQLKQLAKKIQNQAPTAFGVPNVSLHAAQELAARALGHESFHAALQCAKDHEKSSQGPKPLPDLGALARRYVPLWQSESVPTYPTHAIPSWAIEGPQTLGENQEIRFREATGQVYAICPSDDHQNAPRKITLSPEAKVPSGLKTDMDEVLLSLVSLDRSQAEPTTADHLKEAIWAGQLGLRLNDQGLVGPPEPIIEGLMSGLRLLPPTLGMGPEDPTDRAFIRALLEGTVPALCWLRDQDKGIGLSRASLLEQIDWDYMGNLAEFTTLPNSVEKSLGRVLGNDNMPMFQWCAHKVRRSLKEVDLIGRDQALRQRASKPQRRPSRNRP